jgi:pyrroline-5-carboxylate reductase
MAKLKRRLGVLGAGKMGSALVRSFIGAGLVSPDRVIASDVDRSSLDRLRKETGIKVTRDNVEAAKSSEILLVALKPDVCRTALREIRGCLGPNHLIVSIAAGLPIKAIEEAVGERRRIIRVMPNTPCLVGAGASGYSPGKGATSEDRDDVQALLSSVGIAFELPEKHLNAVTGLSGSGPAYGFMVIEALADGGVKMGLPRPVALQLAAQTILGAARMVIEMKRHPGELKDQVASPSGTTIAGIAALERGGLRSTLIEAVEAATKRSIELGKAD